MPIDGGGSCSNAAAAAPATSNDDDDNQTNDRVHGTSVADESNTTKLQFATNSTIESLQQRGSNRKVLFILCFLFSV